MVPPVWIEQTTCRLQGGCSTTELRRPGCELYATPAGVPAAARSHPTAIPRGRPPAGRQAQAWKTSVARLGGDPCAGRFDGERGAQRHGRVLLTERRELHALLV